MKKSLAVIGAVVTALLVVAVLSVGVLYFRWFDVEAERIVVENSRQYIISQQRYLSGLAADCAALDVAIVETDDATLIATYEAQRNAIDRQMAVVADTLDAGDVPAQAIGGCK